MKNRVLFICTGNYYRSRFAEVFFNHYAQKYNLDCVGFSRGFQESTRPFAISPNAQNGLESKNIPFDLSRFPIKLQPKDFMAADQIILMDEIEHYPMLKEEYPEWMNRAIFWQIRDIDFESPCSALPKLEQQLEVLLNDYIIEKASA